MQPNAVADARDLVRQRFRYARWAVLAGSVLTPARTAGSDLDIVVMVGDDENSGAPYRESLSWRGWPVELFVHGPHSLGHYCAEDVRRRRPALHRMLARGVLVAGDEAQAALVQRESAAVLASGPPPLPREELDWARYALTDLLDDLAHSEDPGETTVIATAAWLAVAQLACDLASHWRGSGKWIVRELRDLDPAFTDRWLSAHANPEAVAELAHEVLARAGGALFDGYHAKGNAVGGGVGTAPDQAATVRV